MTDENGRPETEVAPGVEPAPASTIQVMLQAKDPSRVAIVIQGAVEKEIARLQKGCDLAMAHLEHFERQYNVPSSEFVDRFAAEDLAGGDLEYVEWMGEYRLFQQLVEELALLKSLTYAVI